MRLNNIGAGNRSINRINRLTSTAALATAVGAVMLGSFASHASAAVLVWNGPLGGGAWNVGANWTPAGPPVAIDTATFDSGTATPATVVINTGDIATSVIFNSANAAAYTIGTAASPALTLADTTRTIVVNNTVTTNQAFNAQVLLGSAAGTNSTATNNGSGTLTFAGGFSTAQTGTKTLAITGANGTAVSGPITNGAGTLALTKSYGVGTPSTLTLTGANTYTGTTLVDVGTLKLDFANSAVTTNIINNGLGSGGSGLTLGRTSQNVATGATLQIVGGTTPGGTSSQRFNATTFTGLYDDVRVSQTPGTTVNLQLGGLTRTNFALVDFTLPTNGTVTTSTLTNSNGVLIATTVLGAYATVDGTDWVTNTAGTLGQLATYTTAAAAGATDNVSLSADETLTAAAINTLRFNSATNRTLGLTATHTVTSGGVLVTAGSTNGATLGTSVDNGIIKPSSTTLNFINRSPGTLTINSVVTNGSAASSILYSGNTLLRGTNTYTGSSNVYPGTTNITRAANLGGLTGSVNVYTGGTLELDGSAGAIALDAGKTFTINSNGAPGKGGAIRNVAGNNTIGGGIGVGNSSTENTIFSAAGKLMIGGLITANNGRVVFDGPGDLQIDGGYNLNSSSGAQFFKSGSGTVFANGTTNVTGSLTINDGIYDSTLAALPFNSATFASNAAINLNGGILEIRDGGTFTRNIATSPGTNGVRLNQSSAGFAARGTADAIVNAGGASAGVTWGTSGFMSTGSEFLLSSTIADRVIDFQNPINLNNAVRTVRVFDNVASTGDSAELSGILSSTVNANGGLTKEGAGTLLLTGASTYTGPTTVNGGTLLVGDSASVGSLAATTVAVNGPSILGGSGTIGGAVNVNSGGHLSPGNSVGTLTINNLLTLASGSFSDFELASASFYDQIVGLTGASYDGTLNVTGTVDPVQNVYTLFTLASGSGVGNFATVNLPPTPMGYVWRDFDPGVGVSNFDNASGSIELVLVPEPSMMGLLAIAGAGLVSRRRRHAAK